MRRVHQLARGIEIGVTDLRDVVDTAEGIHHSVQRLRLSEGIAAVILRRVSCVISRWESCFL